jgi:hypothetical protein
MEHELINKVATLLRQEGFKNITREKSSLSNTLAAERDGKRVVFHISEARAVETSAAVPHSAAPEGLEISMRAALPGFRVTTPALREKPDKELLSKLRQGGFSG